jgi:hypothetical protein
MTRQEKDDIIQVFSSIIIQLEERYVFWICNAIENSNFTIYSKKLALDYFRSQKPTVRKNKQFYGDGFYNPKNNEHPWWPMGITGYNNCNTRVKFLEHLINKLKK